MSIEQVPACEYAMSILFQQQRGCAQAGDTASRNACICASTSPETVQFYCTGIDENAWRSVYQTALSDRVAACRAAGLPVPDVSVLPLPDGIVLPTAYPTTSWAPTLYPTDTYPQTTSQYPNSKTTTSSKMNPTYYYSGQYTVSSSVPPTGYIYANNGNKTPGYGSSAAKRGNGMMAFVLLVAIVL
ncbi:hypothetical protein HDU80_008484 [Chytriomyces hyalinus]|nr:hypothetical protein HDU80_008484 [Chytriomyces hyalinus]